QEKRNGWGFEKLCEKLDAPLSDEFKQTCYQICGAELAIKKPTGVRRILDGAERWIFHRAMSLVPLADKFGWGTRLARAIGFDNFYYNGPFPMFYSGVMAGGRVNPFFLRYLERRRDPAFFDLLEAAQERSAQ
ncbi:MAG: hypothetical protein WCH98_21515, partial [Verrucomicrobiota bacterium]